MEWLTENKEWLFSGLLVAVPLAIIGWVFFRPSKKQVQRQKGGHGSTNIQAGGDIEIRRDPPDD